MNPPKKTRRRLYVSIRRKVFILFTLFVTVVFALVFYWFFDFATRLAENDLIRDLGSIAETAAQGIDGDMHQALYKSDILEGRPMTDERYQKIVEWLALVKESQGKVKTSEDEEAYRVLLYTYVATNESGAVRFVGSSSALNQPPSGAQFRELYQTHTESSQNFMLSGLLETSVNIEVPITDEWGRWVSGFSPIYNSQGEAVGAVGVDMRETTVVAFQNQIRNTVVPAFLITYSVLLSGATLLAYLISRPLVELTHSAEQVAGGDYSEGVIPEMPGIFRDETATLADVLRQMVAKVAARERSLKKEVQKLRIEIDEVKRHQQVSEIVDTDFFQDLKSKARVLRQRRSTSASDENESQPEDST